MEQLTDIMDWSRTHCFRRLGICWGAQALLNFHGVQKHDCGEKLFGVFRHELKPVPGRLCAASRIIFRCRSRAIPKTGARSSRPPA